MNWKQGIMPKAVHIAPIEQNFRGISYGDWAGMWWNWLLSEEPELYNGHEMLFLRGNVSYGPLEHIKGAPRGLGRIRCHDRTAEKGETIWRGVPVFFPVINAAYCLGDRYEGTRLTQEDDVRYAARKDIIEGGDMRAEISYGNQKPLKLVRDLKKYFTESPIFDLRVPRKSALRDKMENALKPGIYKCVTVGYYILISSLSPGEYRLRIEAKGRGNYYTNAVYDIIVRGEWSDSVRDVSNSKIAIE